MTSKRPVDFCLPKLTTRLPRCRPANNITITPFSLKLGRRRHFFNIFLDSCLIDPFLLSVDNDDDVSFALLVESVFLRLAAKRAERTYFGST